MGSVVAHGLAADDLVAGLRMTGAAKAFGSEAAVRSTTRRALHARVWSQPMTVVAKELGVSRNGLAKICDRLLIPYPGRGYWTKAPENRSRKTPLPPAPAGVGERVSIAPDRAPSRRRRTRLPKAARVEQLIDAAARAIVKDGLAAATMKRVARDVGISEAQAHNYFARRSDMLTALARRELAAIDAARLSEADRAPDNLTRVTLSTITYLRQVDERGAVIQPLLASPEVRAGLRADREAQARSGRRQMTDRLEQRYGVPRELGSAATTVLTAVCLRAGRLLAERKITLPTAERLALAVVTAGNRSLAGLARASAPAEA
jgi:AcrR family transcriptional regulator